MKEEKENNSLGMHTVGAIGVGLVAMMNRTSRVRTPVSYGVQAGIARA